jgi:hypothetical protein
MIIKAKPSQSQQQYQMLQVSVNNYTVIARLSIFLNLMKIKQYLREREEKMPEII